MRFHDSQPERTGQLETAAFQALISELSRADDPRVHGELRLVVTHARELVSRSDDILAADLMTWVGLFDYVRGAYNSAESLWSRECELRRTLLGAEHPDTSISAWNLLNTLGEMGDVNEAMKKILKNDLVWLLDRDPESLGAYQGHIREMIIRMLQGADRPE
jgi:hypothetical protein